MQIQRTRFSRRFNRTGSTYVIVISVALIASLMAFASLAVSRSNREESSLENDLITAIDHSRSAIELAMAEIQTRPDWRTEFAAYQSDASAAQIEFGDDRLHWYAVDPFDADTSDSLYDPVRLFGVGVSGEAIQTMSCLAFPTGRPLPVLGTSLHVGGDLTLNKELITAIGPVSCNGTIDGQSNLLYGDYEATSWANVVSLGGGGTTKAIPEIHPSPWVFDAFKNIATKVDYTTVTGDLINDQLINNAVPPTVATKVNANGVYYIMVPEQTELELRNCRLTATLLVELDGLNSRFKIGSGVIWHPPSDRMPSLIVLAKTDSGNRVSIHSRGQFDLSLPGLSGPASLNGLFQIIRPNASTSLTRLNAPRGIRGSVLVDGDVSVDGTTIVRADPASMYRPPLGYQWGPALADVILSGSFEGGIRPWYPIGATDLGGGTRIQHDSEAAAGAKSLKVTRRNSGSDGVAIDITDRMVNGETYNLSGQIKTATQVENVILTLEIVDENGLDTSRQFINSISTGWTAVNHSTAISWSGKLESVVLKISSVTSNQDFWLDAVQLSPANGRVNSNLSLAPNSFSTGN